MAILTRYHLTGMTPSRYDEISRALVERVKAEPGFMIGVAFMDAGVFTVSEIWESREQHDRWFDENVRPNVPGVQQDWVIEVHSVYKP